MHRRTAGRATTAALGLVLACSGIAAADSVYGDADTVVLGNQAFVNLGTVSAGATVKADVALELACLGTSHVDPDVIVTLTPTTTPATGGSMTATAVTIGPVPETWPVDGDPCVGDPVLRGDAVSKVSMTAPGSAGNHVFKVAYAKAPTGGITGTTIVQFLVTVASNTAPSLGLPADLTVEGDAPGGWRAQYVATATDAEDDPDPAVVCDPAAGDVLPLGTTTVWCSATDTGGATTSGSFQVTVVDTTPPALAQVSDLDVVATGPAGASVDFPVPAASDAVDPSPVVACDPPTGSTFASGSTTVTCTATDASGNSSATSFTVSVERRQAALTGIWHRPLADAVPALIAQAGRTVPLKLHVSGDGRVMGPADMAGPVLRVEQLGACSASAEPGGLLREGRFAWSDGLWQANLDTTGLGTGCVRVTATSNDAPVASAVIELLGNPAVAKRRR